jgi:hypothetical protein
MKLSLACLWQEWQFCRRLGRAGSRVRNRNGDAAALRQLLEEDSSRANELISWGERKPCLTHPLHFIEGTLQQGKEIPLLTC